MIETMNESPLPDRRVALRRLLALPLACLQPMSVMASQDERGWTPLFNGTNFEGWETFLGRPHPSSDVAGARDGRGNTSSRLASGAIRRACSRS
jgi:hypothetical protein